ncbi:MAG: HD-GYP domain-containing protein [Lachnospiraceae bacterium]|nr:HD-GYP domain-containing protein [Lachnospiraceae bacterium]
MKKNYFIQIGVFFLLAIVTIAAIVYSSNVFFYRSLEKDRRETMVGMAKFATMFLSGDQIEDWLENGTDESYDQKGEMLKGILSNTPYMKTLYVYRILPQELICIYDFAYETEEEQEVVSLADFGESSPMESFYAPETERLIKGESIYDSSVMVMGNMSIYEAIYDSEGNYVAHVCADFSRASIEGYILGILKWVVVIAVFFLIACSIIGIRMNMNFRNMEKLEASIERYKHDRHLFEQTAFALANAIDAKDEYTRGHSTRVADYSKKIAKESGMSDEECDEVFYAALLHDVGKIGVKDSIINKKGKLTAEEYAEMKQHPVTGNQILTSIDEYPYLSIGAHYHHERYDGKGYPDGLKGEDIPQLARIIAVADAYDAMASKRSYRDAIPQQMVREEIVKCTGTQFDPKYAKIMQHLIDLDIEYAMSEKYLDDDLKNQNEVICEKLRSAISIGVQAVGEKTKIHFKYQADAPGSVPMIVLYDSLDARYHEDERKIKDLNYFEYAEIWADGRFTCKGARKVKVSECKGGSSHKPEKSGTAKIYEITTMKYKDHVKLLIDHGGKVLEITVALPDNSRYAYVAVTGEKCKIYDFSASLTGEEIGRDEIERIAEEINYIDVPAGDLPNVQVDGYRTDSSEGILVKDGMKVSFHAKSLPTARLVWHCPFVVLYSSEDKKVNGPGYKEYALIRFDGENWDSGEISSNKMLINHDEHFGDWEAWKEGNKKGMDCVVEFSKDGDDITTSTNNLGISIKNITTINDGTQEIYASLTGDQCAIINIQIK